MRFHWKMTLCMLALLAVLFGAGGSLLISASFRDSLDREKSAAFASYRMAWGTLNIVNGLDPYLDREAIAQTMEQLYQQDSTAWALFLLSGGDEAIYQAGLPALGLSREAERPEPGRCLTWVEDDGAGGHYLFFSGAVETNWDVLYLTTARDVSALYDARETQRSTYLQVFRVMCLLCGLLSYTVSRVLTAPLGDLSRATRDIATGKLSSRVRVRSEDEVGMVPRDFNAMADQMERYIEELRQSVERQERFVGSFAHEMKTPMTSLIGYAELIRGGTLTQEEQAEAAGWLYSEGKRLESLSRKLLDLLVLRQEQVVFASVSPGALAMELAERLGPVYAEKNITISCGCERGDCLLEPDLAWSLLLNLADNAQKAMEGGGELAFRVELLEDGCRIQVLDTGRGVPPEALDHLTDAFYRVDKARSRAQGGFGLGLSLCREIVDLHHGSIRFENRETGGTCVTVELRGGRR